MRESIGFVGLGQMGQPLARLLLQALGPERDLRVFDLREERLAPLLALGAAQAFRLGEVAQPGGIVVSMVPDDQALRQIAGGEDGLLSQLAEGGAHLSLSTISPALARELARVYARQHCAFLAATVLGRPEVVERGEASVLLSGETAAKERVLPLLRMLSTHLVDLGEQQDAAAIAKIGVNALISAAIEALGEVVHLMEKGGLERRAFLQVLTTSVLFRCAVYEGYSRLIGERLFTETPFPVRMGLKDGTLTRQFADELEVRFPIGELSFAHLQAALAAGCGELDWSALTTFVAAPPAA